MSHRSKHGDHDKEILNLLQTMSPELLRFFLRRLGDTEASADALADLFLLVWRRRATVPTNLTELRLWIYGAAGNIVRNQRRSSRRASQLAASLRMEISTHGPTSSDPSDAFAKADEVSRALNVLPYDLAELLRLVHWDGLSLAEAALVQGIPASTTRSRYQSAKARLRDALYVHEES